MHPSQLENWILQIVDRAKSGHPNEDARVELKSDWPDPGKAARRIAAHCNASRGEHVLWVIGVDERRQAVPGAKNEEMANWWPGVQSHFDGLAPDLLNHIVVPTDGAPVVALLFDTTRAPFVIMNAGAPPTLEVPWRDATGVRSARRSDLIRLLVPLQRTPEVELLKGRLYAAPRNEPGGAKGLEWGLHLSLYIVPASPERIVIPFHKCAVTVIVPDYLPERTPAVLSMQPLEGAGFAGERLRSRTIAGTPSEIVVDGPGRVDVNLMFHSAVPDAQPGQTARAVAFLQAVDARSPAIVEAELTAAPEFVSHRPIWTFPTGSPGL